jgi:hypothetical protein
MTLAVPTFPVEEPHGGTAPAATGGTTPRVVVS